MATIPKTITVTEKNEKWINSRVESGDFGNASEYIRNLIRQDQEQQTKIEAIRQALIKGEQSGLSSLSPEEIMEAVIKKNGRNGKL